MRQISEEGNSRGLAVDDVELKRNCSNEKLMLVNFSRGFSRPTVVFDDDDDVESMSTEISS